MRNDSIESLLQRHYGSAAPAPAALEHQLHASVRNTAAALQIQQEAATHARQRRVSRRQAVRLVALSTAGLSILNIGLESLQAFEDSLVGQEATGTAYP